MKERDEKDGSEFAKQLASARPVTRHLVTSILLDAWPNHRAIVDFGIESQEHYEALYYPIRQREITPEMLDRVLGQGKALTMMVCQAPSNPHPDIEFQTCWDAIPGDDLAVIMDDLEQDIEPEF